MRAAVAAGHAVTAQAAADVLARGGNAVDAVVAAGAMSWAAEPALTGPCGGGFLLVRPAATGRLHLLDAFTSIAGRDLPRGRRVGVPEEVVVPFDERTTQVFHIGPAACAVPGVVAGLRAAHRRFGSLPWDGLLLPAAAAARAGVVAERGQYAVLVAIREILRHTPEARAVFAPAGRLVALGERVVQADLAATIERLAEAPGDLYTGRLGAAAVEHQAATGGPLTAADLAAYRPVWRRPLVLRYGRHMVATNPPPSSGGVLIAYMLSVLAGADEPLRPGQARTLRAYAETMRAAARLRDERFARLLHRGGLARHMLGARAVEAGRRAVRAALAGPEAAPAPALVSDAGTTHISVVDDRGTACAFTGSNGSHSGVIVPGTGLHLNNMMGEDDLAAGRGLGPGARLTSMQAPTMAVGERGDLELVIGSSGSNRLRSAILQVSLNVLDHGMPAADAVAHPRVHVEGERLDCEGGIAEDVIAELEAWGERVNRFGGLNLYFGGTNVIAARGGRTEAAGDPRRDGHGIVLQA